MNHNIKNYFDSHQKVDTFHFTSDGMGFFKKEDASSHATRLGRSKKSTVVTTVTRGEVDAWHKEQAIKDVQAAKEALETAEKAEATAKSEVMALPKNATPAKRGAATQAFNKASADLIRAQEALETAEQIAGSNTPEATPELTLEQKKADAQLVLDNATKAFNEATTAQAALGDDATGAQKSAATKAVNKAKATVDAAQVAIDELEA